MRDVALSLATFALAGVRLATERCAAPSVSSCWKDFSEVGKNLATILAALAGGLWVYYNSVRGRVHKPTVDCLVTAEPIRFAGHLQILVRVKLKNKGKGRVTFLGRHAVDLWLPATEDLDAAADPDLSVITRRWEDEPSTIEVFEKHRWLEPGEVIEDVKLLTLLRHPSEPIVRLRFSATARGWRFIVPIRQGIGSDQILVTEKETVNGYNEGR